MLEKQPEADCVFFVIVKDFYLSTCLIDVLPELILFLSMTSGEYGRCRMVCYFFSSLFLHVSNHKS